MIAVGRCRVRVEPGVQEDAKIGLGSGAKGCESRRGQVGLCGLARGEAGQKAIRGGQLGGQGEGRSKRFAAGGGQRVGSESRQDFDGSKVPKGGCGLKGSQAIGAGNLQKGCARGEHLEDLGVVRASGGPSRVAQGGVAEVRIRSGRESPQRAASLACAASGKEALGLAQSFAVSVVALGRDVLQDGRLSKHGAVDGNGMGSAGAVSRSRSARGGGALLAVARGAAGAIAGVGGRLGG